MHTIAGCHQSSSIETSMCLLDFIYANYIAIYSKAQEESRGIYITGSFAFLQLDITYMGGKEGPPPIHLQIYIRRWWGSLTKYSQCYFTLFFSKSCLGNCQSSRRTNRRPSLLFLERELPQGATTGRHWQRSWRQSLCKSPPLLFWGKVWSSHCSIELGGTSGRRRRSSGTSESPPLLARVQGSVVQVRGRKRGSCMQTRRATIYVMWWLGSLDGVVPQNGSQRCLISNRVVIDTENFGHYILGSNL